MAKGYVVGIDGGGTSTKSGLLALNNFSWEKDLNESLYMTYENGATNYHSVGAEVAKQRFKEVLDHFNLMIHRQKGHDLAASDDAIYSQIVSVCLGGAGIDSVRDQLTVEAMFREIGYHGKLSIVNDSVAALVGGNKGAEGGIVIAGTGSIAYGMHLEKMVRVGGWGNLLDDEGSGYDIGRAALKQILESYDGRYKSPLNDEEKPSQLWKSVQAAFGFEHEEDIIHFVYGPEATKSDVAAVAPIVLGLYGSDAQATEIVDHSVAGLCRLVIALAEGLNRKDFPLTLGGSLLMKSELYRDLFTKQVQQRLPQVRVHMPLENPVAGALRLALERAEF